jgi:hypothetical protein
VVVATALDRRTWPPVLGGFAIGLAVLVLSTLTTFFQRSPIHSESWWPLLTVWGGALGIGLVLSALRRPAWGAAWVMGAFGGAVAFIGSVFIFVVTHGS